MPTHSLPKWVEVSPEQKQMAFVATCIEATARITGQPYDDVFRRMERLGLIDDYIIPNYGVLHLESRENLVDDLLECMDNKEKRQ